MVDNDNDQLAAIIMSMKMDEGDKTGTGQNCSRIFKCMSFRIRLDFVGLPCSRI